MAAAFISTLKERCRVCFTCVRECPAKAIRIADGQAEIVPERCIGCGNCVRVCGKHAKEVVSSVEQVETLLQLPGHKAACLAPSFAAEFADMDYRDLVGFVRALGFDTVHEVAFGADLVANEYREMLEECDDQQYISSACPAIVGYVERYHPELIDRLAPIVSPMVALARYLRVRWGHEMTMVFIGPCVAKKVEADDDPLQGEIDAALTFRELRQMFTRAGVNNQAIEPSEFDPPHGGVGSLYPICRGALQAAGLRDDLLTGEVFATHGQYHMRDAIHEFAHGHLGVKLLELLCCEGCIMGAGMTNELPLFVRRRLVRDFAKQRLNRLDWSQWQRNIDFGARVPLQRSFTNRDQRLTLPDDARLQEILERLGKATPEDELNCGACGYDTCREHAIAIHRGFAENEMCLPQTIHRLSEAITDLEESHRQLASTQEALMQSEKLASMGQLAAGIAHEVNNPLGIVLMYAHLLLDECQRDQPQYSDIQMIAEQADRCKKIVAGLLNFARQNKVSRHPTHMPELVRRVLAPVQPTEGVRLRIESTMRNEVAEIDRDQIAQVLTNLVNNALAAIAPPGEVVVTCSDDDSWVVLAVHDTGSGIPKDIVKKIFEPFFTTKQPGQGTGLGLAVSYGIVKMHSGDIVVESNADPTAGPTGTTFRVKLPRTE